MELNGPTPTFIFHEIGNYSVQLIITDTAGNRGFDFITIFVRDISKPIPDAGSDRTINQHQGCLFNGSNSTDNDGINSWIWTLYYNRSINLMNGPIPSFVFHDVGVYLITLNVTDYSGNWATDVIIITVKDITSPTAKAGPDIFINQGQVAIFNGTYCTDNVEISYWNWSLLYGGSRILLYGSSSSFQFWIVGTYNITLTVYDAEGNHATDAFTINVKDIIPPIAHAGMNLTIWKGATVRLNGSASYDNVLIINWTWTYVYSGKQIVLNGWIHEILFNETGDYIINLSVQDRAGNVGYDHVTISVKDPPVNDYRIDDDQENMSRILMLLVISLIMISIVITWFLHKKKRSL